VRWWINTSETTISGSISAIQERVIQAFNENGVSIPYPVQEVKIIRSEAAGLQAE
jgi:small-conductance mechanosensitive channel